MVFMLSWDDDECQQKTYHVTGTMLEMSQGDLLGNDFIT